MSSFLSSINKQFVYYKSLGDKCFEQINDEQVFELLGPESNSIASIVKHMHGNMMSRWTDFRKSDGEKTWRNRDQEFDHDIPSKKELLEKWEEGWACLFAALNSLKTEDLEKEVFIRNMGHTITEAINRQLAHYAYHVGQIVFISKTIRGDSWETLSIAKGASKEYNDEKFAKPKRREHFTDDL